ncbi:MAG: MFS transporter [Muribaculaceae bacterium]|nr:MFS transporter [Muribaculaceae bacterium]
MANSQRNKHPLIANRTAFMVIGCLEAAWAPLVPYVKSAFSLDEEALGLLMLCSGLGSIISLPVSGWLCMKFGAKQVVYFSGSLMALALLAISLMVNVWLTALMLMIFGGCTISIDVAANINGVAIEHRTGKHLMSGFHGGYSLGTLIGAGVMSVLFSLGVVPAWAVALSMVMILAAMMLGCRDLLKKKELENANPTTATKTVKRKRFYIPPMVIVIGLLCFIMYAAEGAVMGWSAIFVSEERGVDMSVAGFFYTAFAIMMTVMRFLGDKIVDRLGQRRVVVLGALSIAAGFLMVISIPSIVATALGFALIGMGAANIVPQFISFASGIKGMAVQNIISIVNALGYSGILLGPVLIGFVAKHYGLHTSFAAIAVFALVVALVSAVALKRKI